MNYVWIGIAGIVGTWLRYGISLWIQRLSPQLLFPIGTLTVNLIGCFVLGWFSQWALNKACITPRIRTGIQTGLIGSFTTFSTFSVETVQLFQHELYASAAAYMGISLVGGLCLVWLGAATAGRGRERSQNG